MPSIAVTPPTMSGALGRRPIARRETDTYAGSTRRMVDEDPARLLGRCLEGNGAATRRLVRRMTAVIHQRVGQVVLRKRASAAGRDIRQDVEDLVQEVLAVCFANRARVLRTWDPNRGLSFDNFVGLVAQREALSILRTAKRSPWTEDPTLPSTLEVIAAPGGGAQQRVESKDMLVKLADRMRERLSPMGMRYFSALFVEQRDVQQVAQEAGTTTGALYMWRLRLTKMIRTIFDEIQAEVDAHE